MLRERNSSRNLLSLRLLYRLRRFRSWKPHQRRLALEAVFFLLSARLLVMVIPFRYYHRLLGRQGLESDREVVVDRQARRSAHTVQVVSKYCFWQCRCLTQAIALKFILRRRRINCTVYLGVARSEADGLRAHAWLRCGQEILVGAEGHQEFAIVARFSEPA